MPHNTEKCYAACGFYKGCILIHLFTICYQTNGRFDGFSQNTPPIKNKRIIASVFYFICFIRIIILKIHTINHKTDIITIT